MWCCFENNNNVVKEQERNKTQTTKTTEKYNEKKRRESPKRKHAMNERWVMMDLSSFIHFDERCDNDEKLIRFFFSTK